MAVKYYISQQDEDKYTGPLSLTEGSYGYLTYKGLNQLYYSNFVSGSVETTDSNHTGSFDNFLESSFTSGSRHLFNTASVFTLPTKMVGTHIEPLTFKMGTKVEYIEIQDDYIVPGYFYTGLIVDDGEGVLRDGSTNGPIVGNIIYSHGQIIITDETLAASYIDLVNSSGSLDLPMSWKSNQPIYTYNYNVKISDYEYNYTFNPTAQTGSTALVYSGSRYTQPSGILADNVTGSYFQPYITTVGLYNDSNELIAVAKLAQPLPKSANTEMTIQVKLDI